jgi:hypothetical protein
MLEKILTINSNKVNSSWMLFGAIIGISLGFTSIVFTADKMHAVLASKINFFLAELIAVGLYLSTTAIMMISVSSRSAISAHPMCSESFASSTTKLITPRPSCVRQKSLRS